MSPFSVGATKPYTYNPIRQAGDFLPNIPQNVVGLFYPAVQIALVGGDSNTCLVEYPHQNPNSVPTRSRQVRLSASHVDSCRSRPAYHRTHTRRLQMYQSGVSETHGLLDRHDGTAQTMPSSVRGSAMAFAIAGARRFFYMRSCTRLNRSSGMIAGTPPLITTS